MTNRRSPSPNPVNNLIPTMNTTKSSTKHSSNPTTPLSTKTDDFVLIPDQAHHEKSLPPGRFQLTSLVHLIDEFLR